MATCADCGKDVISVRDAYTGAIFAVDIHPTTVKGFELSDPENGERLQRAHFDPERKIYRPHASICPGPAIEAEEEEGGDG